MRHKQNCVIIGAACEADEEGKKTNEARQQRRTPPVTPEGQIKGDNNEGKDDKRRKTTVPDTTQMKVKGDK